MTGEPIPFGQFLDACQAGTGRPDAVLQWAPAARLLDAGVDPWMGVPLWVAAPGWEAANDADVSRALAAGLRLRPLVETIRDTLAWDLARGGPEPGKEGLSREREKDCCAAWPTRPDPSRLARSNPGPTAKTVYTTRLITNGEPHARSAPVSIPGE